MSKIYDVEKMYGQDFSIVTTNAPSNIVKQAKKLLSNTLLISSPQDENGEDEDNNMPAIFVTDFNAQPLQLTYPLYMKNGLNYSDKYGYAFINIDNSTIKTENLDGSGNLRVDTNNLSNATFNKKGVVKLSNTLTDVNRNLKENYNLQDSISGKYNNSTFITVNNDGILYLNNDLLDLINNLVDLKIKQKIDSIKIMLNSNLKMWIEIVAVNGSIPLNNIHTVGSLTDTVSIDNNNTTSLTFNLHYLSFNYESETVQVIDSSNKIYSIEFENDDHNTIVEPVENNDELYQHTLNNISIIFLPNYFVENNENYKQEISLIFEIDNDKSETLLFQQDKLTNYDIDVNINQELNINDILNTSETSGIIETITLGGFRDVILNENKIINYQVNTFIINNSDDINNYELLTINDYDISDNGIAINNVDNNIKSKLYSFIYGIIDQDEEDNEFDSQYIIDTSKYIQNNGQDIRIDEYVTQKINNNELNYYVNIGTILKIITDKKQEIGSYYKKIQIPLNIDKRTIYGYILITGNEISNYNNNTFAKHIYYEKRANNTERIYVNSIDNLDINTINPRNLYCIYNDVNIDQEFNLYIPFISFDTYNTENKKSSKIEDSNQISFSSNTNDVNISINTDDQVHKKINIKFNNNIIDNIINILYNGFTFNINYNQQQGQSSIIKSQKVELNINMLEILIENLELGYLDDNNHWVGTKLNKTNIDNDYNSPEYYQMDNYIIKGFSNNKIKGIKFNVPNCIQKILSNVDESLLMHLYFYINTNNGSYIHHETIKFNKDSNTNNILGSIDNSNGIDPILTIDSNNLIITYSSEYLPKLLYIGFSIKANENKYCYIENDYSCNGGDISQSNNSNNYLSKQLYTISNNSQLLYDIISVTNESLEDEAITTFKQNMLKHKLNNQSNDIVVNDLDLSGLSLKFDDGSLGTDTLKFKLLINDNDEYTNANFGIKYNTNFKYQYLNNPNNDLDQYNQYSPTLINGGEQTTSTGYQIRLNNILFELKSNLNNENNDIYIKDNNDTKSIIIYYSGNLENKLYNLKNKILNKIFEFSINGYEDNNLFNKIYLENLKNDNDSVNHYLHKLIFDDWTLNNTIISDLFLNYEISYYHLNWEGISKTYNGNSDHYTEQINIVINTNSSNGPIFSDYILEPANVTYQNNDTSFTPYFKLDNSDDPPMQFNGGSENNDVYHNILNTLNDLSPNGSKYLTYKVYINDSGTYIPLKYNIKFGLFNSSANIINLEDSALFIDGSYTNPTNSNCTQLATISINEVNGTANATFYVYYDHNKIYDDINNNDIIVSSNTTEITRDDEPHQFGNPDDPYMYIKYHCNSSGQHDIKISVKGRSSNGNQYANRDYYCTLIVNKQEYSLDDFHWNNVLDDPIESINNLPTLTIPSGKTLDDISCLSYNISTGEGEEQEQEQTDQIGLSFSNNIGNINIHEDLCDGSTRRCKISVILKGDDYHVNTLREIAFNFNIQPSQNNSGE